MDDYVSFEISKKLKEKGFNKLCIYAYCEEGGWNKYKQINKPVTHVLRTDGNPFGTFYTGKNWNVKYKTNKNKIRCSAPTISQVSKWLIDEKNIYIEIFLYNRKYSYLINSTTKICEDDLFHECLNSDDDSSDDEYEDPKDAMLAGIKYVLDNLI